VTGSTATAPLLEVDGLAKAFDHTGGPMGRRTGQVRAVDGVSFTIAEGTTFALVGESGCGKTTTARMLLLLERPTAGKIRFYGQEVTGLRGRGLRTYKRSVQAVFQDPYASLSPRMRVRDIVGEPLQIHEGLRGKELGIRVAELLDQVGLNPATAAYYPHQFSGGQRQRIAIARAISLNPKLVVLDEPVSALDVSIRAQILNLLVDLQERLGLSYLLISHDLAIVEFMSHQVAVMYAGQIVEVAPSDELYRSPNHPYTQALMAAVPSTDPDTPLGRIAGGEVANPANPPSGCRFHPRCPLRAELGSPPICAELAPPLVQLGQGLSCACHFVGPGAESRQRIGASIA
jgi:oligopeptide transport system ATP-binding protein